MCVALAYVNTKYFRKKFCSKLSSQKKLKLKPLAFKRSKILSVGHIFLILVFSSRTAIADTIIGLFLVLISSTGFLLRAYDITITTKSAFCSFVHAFSTELRV